MKDYYKILGVNKKSTKDEIKKSYRKLSKKYHPDVNPNGGDKFKEIVEAYETLTDDDKKAKYDNPNLFNNQRSNGFDPFSNFMNQFRSQNQKNRRRPVKKINIQINPIESFKGVSKAITYQTNNTCGTCAGSGGKKNVCQTCKGSGNIRRKMGSGFVNHIIDTPCSSCNGVGSIMIDPCFNCQGKGIKQKIENITVDIPPNVNTGEYLRVKGKGDFTPNLGFGDLILQIEVINSDNFEKINHDLVYTKSVKLYDLIIENEISLPHPDGEVLISIPKNTETGKPLRLKGKGYKTNGGVGDFYVKMSVVNEIMDAEMKNNIIEKLKV